MDTQNPGLRRLLPALVMMMASAVAAIFVWQAFGGRVPLSAKGYRVRVALPQALNLYPMADVRMAGVSVGQVVAVDRVGAAARATIELRGPFVPIRTDATVILRSKSLLGETYLELTPGSRSASAVPDGGQLPVSAARPAQQLEDVLGVFAPSTRRRMRALLAGLAEGMAGRQQDLSDSVARMAPVSADLAHVTGRLAAQSADLRSLLANAGDVFGAIGERDGALRAAVRSSRLVLSVTGERNRRIAATVHELPAFLRALRTATGRLGAATGDLHRTVGALRPAAPALGPALDEIQATGPEVRRLLSRSPAVIRAGNRGLPALTSILHASGPALRQTYPALRDVVPVLRLLGTNRDSVITTLANVAQVHNGTYVGPGDRVFSYANGLINIWNETVAGWVKRLPSNRGNPYPKPGFVSGIAKGLASFDCRHLRNPAYLPPFGGVPPCHEQGPWTFDGKTAYFPRLSRAAP
ncbi:MlaD family protein [Paraconexibacter antarcticus]|uniref:MlaD family protein n=1 Tax=Paraconexibacter antarcticus TaxID=2949664 RepID=A0ABY5DYV1_9ACTN|nr:MlaD family protein [Paraconexibacter antarcticus]UTI66739.1 MlaD family protein [Paraconexibacter antarcticus]